MITVDKNLLIFLAKVHYVQCAEFWMFGTLFHAAVDDMNARAAAPFPNAKPYPHITGVAITSCIVCTANNDL